MLLPVENTVPKPLAEKADRRIGGAMAPEMLLPRSTVNCWSGEPLRPSLKLIWLAELTAAVAEIVRFPRLTLIGPVRPVFVPPRVTDPFTVKPAVETSAELIVMLLGEIRFLHEFFFKDRIAINMTAGFAAHDSIMPEGRGGGSGETPKLVRMRLLPTRMMRGVRE